MEAAWALLCIRASTKGAALGLPVQGLLLPWWGGQESSGRQETHPTAGAAEDGGLRCPSVPVLPSGHRGVAGVGDR